jgi:hypothetical protein
MTQLGSQQWLMKRARFALLHFPRREEASKAAARLPPKGETDAPEGGARESERVRRATQRKPFTTYAPGRVDELLVVELEQIRVALARVLFHPQVHFLAGDDFTNVLHDELRKHAALVKNL